MTKNNLFPDCYKVKDINLAINKGFYSDGTDYISFIPIYYNYKKALLYLKIIIDTEGNNDIRYSVVNENNNLYYGFYNRDKVYEKFNKILDKKIINVLDDFVKKDILYKVEKKLKTKKRTNKVNNKTKGRTNSSENKSI